MVIYHQLPHPNTQHTVSTVIALSFASNDVASIFTIYYLLQINVLVLAIESVGSNQEVSAFIVAAVAGERRADRGFDPDTRITIVFDRLLLCGPTRR